VANIASLMPQVRLGEHSISRLIVGGNPFSGNSHLSPEADDEMRRFYSGRRILETLRRCEKWGINTVQARADNHIMRLLVDYWESGGRLQWVAQTASERADVRANIRQAARLRPIGIYHHGSKTDEYWAQGRIDEVRDALLFIRDQGILAGLGTHAPEVIAYAEERGWEVDFYMACFYNLTRKPRPSAIASGQFQEEEYNPADPRAMCRIIRQVNKPVLAFKILAASRLARNREALRAAFAFAFANIKPQDAVVVGVFTKYCDQVMEDALLAMELGQACSYTAQPFASWPQFVASPAGSGLEPRTST
jgi:hypothetical protein